MKTKLPLCAVLATAALTSLAHSSLILSDQFNDSTIDTALWQTSTPFGDSSITESGGNAVFVNRGRLLSLASMPTAIDITGRFTFTGNVRDQFNILTRTTGVSTNQWYEFDTGMSFRFQIQNDLGSTANNIKIAHGGFPGPSPDLVTGTYSLALNTPYDFRITDDGTNVALFINDFTTPILTATDSSVLGDKLGIYNREGSGGGSSISAGSTVRLDYIQVVPEPRTALFGLALCGVSLWRRRMR